MRPEADYKICYSPRTGKGCGMRKLKATQFYKNPDSPDGFRNLCKACMGAKKPPKNKQYPFFNSGALALMSTHRFTEVKKFGFFYGILVYIRPMEILAFSVVVDSEQGSKIFPNKMKAKEYLYKKMIIAGERTKVGLTDAVKGV